MEELIGDVSFPDILTIGLHDEGFSWRRPRRNPIP